MTLRVPYLGQTVMANFKGGDRIRSRAKLVTSDRFIQDALEHDPRYGVLFTCVKKYEDTPAQVAKARKITKVKTINDALLYFTQLGASVTGENDLKDLMEQYNVEFPNLSR